MEKQSIFHRLHISITFSITVFFFWFFHLEGIPEWIQQNIQYIPTGQILAYAGYFGGSLFIFAGRILTKPRMKIPIIKSNLIFIAAKKMEEYSTLIIDLVSITIIVYTFFIVGYGQDAESELFWYNICSFAVFPVLAVFVRLALRNQKIDYQIPIFSDILLPKSIP